VLVSERDYAEIEDLMRAGVHALLHPHSPAEWCVEQVRTAAARRKALHSRRRAPHIEQCDSVAAAVKRAVEPTLTESPLPSHPLTDPIVASIAALHP
jgi:DNA-binding NarL/FixJ family response regulator